MTEIREDDYHAPIGKWLPSERAVAGCTPHVCIQNLACGITRDNPTLNAVSLYVLTGLVI